MTMDIVAPTEQEGTKSVLKTWLKNVGDTVRADEPVVELETDKVAVEIAAPGDGVLAEFLIAPEAEVEPGAVLGRIAQGLATSVDKAMAQSAAVPVAPRAKAAGGASQIPPGIRKMLADNGLRENDVPVSGERLTREDIQAEIAATVASEAFFDLDAPVSRLAMPDIPSPHNPVLMEAALPSVDDIRAKIEELIG